MSQREEVHKTIQNTKKHKLEETILNKIYYVLFIAILTISISACKNSAEPISTNPPESVEIESNKKTEQNIFVATVLDNKIKSMLLVEVIQPDKVTKVSEKILVSISTTTSLVKNDKKISEGEIKIGKKVEITYNGIKLESYPGQIRSCSQVKLLD